MNSAKEYLSPLLIKMDFFVGKKGIDFNSLMLKMIYFHKKTTCVFVHITWLSFVCVLSLAGEATRAKLFLAGLLSVLWV